MRRRNLYRNQYFFILIALFSVLSYFNLRYYIRKYIQTKDITHYLTEDKNNEENGRVTTQQKTTTHALVHIGMHKTGTTSIQSFTKTHHAYLQKDGYEMPWLWGLNHHNGKDVKRRKPEHQGDFARCFLEDRANKIFGTCRPSLLSYGDEIAESGRHILISAENFSALQEAEGLKKLKEYLSQWEELRIVIFYRRFYDWISSMHNEEMKKLPLSRRMNIVDFLQQFPHFGIWYNITAAPVVERLKDYFPQENIMVRNYHEDSKGGKLVEHFFCESLQVANVTCGYIRQQEKSAGVVVNKNSKSNLDYDFLIEGAQKAKLVVNSNNIKTATQIQKLRDFWETTLNMTIFDLPRVCPPQHILDSIWNITLYSEKMFFRNELNETEMWLEFENASRRSLCAVDVDQVLTDERLILFLKSLNIDESDKMN